jgi:uncharacterized protein
MNSFSAAVLKLTSFCNINCTYCYMFNLADQSYMGKPRFLSLHAAKLFIEAVNEYITARNVDHFHVTLHGGEPTLWPYDHYTEFFRYLNASDTRAKITVSIQTNAYKRIPPKLVDILAKNRVAVGISIDGPKRINDKARITHRGQGTYDRICANVDQLIKDGIGDLLAGFLSVVDTTVEPSEFLSWVKSLPVKRVDLLLPMQYNYDSPPWGPEHLEEDYALSPRIGRWLSALFLEWFIADDPDTYIRLFVDSIKFALGSKAHADNIVNDTIPMFCVNTDGSIEYPDYLRTAKDGGAATAFSIEKNRLLDFEGDTVFRSLLDLRDQRAIECEGCGVAEFCGGGFVPGRLSAVSNRLDKRSVYCHDHYRFFSTVIETLLKFDGSLPILQPQSAPPLLSKGNTNQIAARA